MRRGVGRGPAPGRRATRRVTRDVELDAVADLLEAPPRSTLAFVAGSGTLALVPVRAVWRDGIHRVGVPPEAPDCAGHEVVLVRDDGVAWFELRSVTVRGVAMPAEPPVTEAPGASGLRWYAVEPRRVVAWDYGSLREV